MSNDPHFHHQETRIPVRTTVEVSNWSKWMTSKLIIKESKGGGATWTGTLFRSSFKSGTNGEVTGSRLHVGSKLRVVLG